MLNKHIKIKPLNHETNPIHTKSKFYVKALRFLKLKGEEEEGKCGEFEGGFKLGSNLKSQRNPQSFSSSKSIPLSTAMAAPLLNQSTRNFHRRSLTQWAKKPIKGLEGSSAKSLQ